MNVRIACLSSLLVVCAAVGTLTGCKPTSGAVDGGTGQNPPITECNAPSTRVPLRLLTRAEYDFTLRDLLGDTSNPSKDFPREPLADGWDNDGNLNQVTDESVARYLEAAETVAANALTTHREKLYVCTTQDAACTTRFISGFGRRAFRRPLTTDELSFFTNFFTSVQTAAAGDFDSAVVATVQVMLQSPQFLYRFEEGEAPTGQQWRTPLGGYELASRLSYFVWGSMPDDALLDDANALSDPDVLAAQAKRMLADPKAKAGKTRFFSLWLRLDDIGTLSKTLAVYPNFTPDLALAWRTSLDLFIDDALTNGGTLSTLLTSNAMFVNDTMSMYATPMAEHEFTKVMMPPAQRSGLLTQPGFLARLSSPDQSSPIRRGIFVLDKLMCQTPPPPPAGANITPPTVTSTGTTRERFAEHSKSAGCHACHQFIDPVGFGFEHFDGIGQYRELDNGQPVDASGEIVTAGEDALVGPFTGATELSARLAQSRQVHDCFSQEWLRFALGRAIGSGDACTVQQVQTDFMKSGGSIDELLLAIVRSDSFRTRPVEATP